jgi:hypothetical protein
MSLENLVMRNILSRVGIAVLSMAASTMVGCGSGGDPSDFLVTVDHASISVMADYTTPAITLSVKAVDAFHATVTFTAVAPPGFTCQPSCTATTTSDGGGTSSIVFRFDTAPEVAGPATYPIVFHGVEAKVGGTIEHDVTVSVAVTAWNGTTPPPDFDFTVTPALQYELVPAHGVLKDDTRYMLTFTRYNHYTGPISVVATLMDPDTFCSTAACSMVDTTDTISAPFLISTDEASGRHMILFTASVAPYVTKTATAQIIVFSAPSLGPPSGGG